MKPSHPILVLILSPSLFSSLALSQSSATVSIYSNSAFKSQRLCALECILCGYGTYGQHDCLAIALSCNSSPLQNSCYYRADLQSAAVSYIASWVSTACSNTVDVENAVGIYTQYCATADQTGGYLPASTTQTALTIQVRASAATATASSMSVVSNTVAAANRQASTVLVTVTPSGGMTQTQTQTAARGSSTLIISSTTPLGSSGGQATPSNTAPTSSSSSVDPGPIIAGALGGALLLGIAAVIVTWLILREKRKHRKTNMAAPSPPVATNRPIVVPPTS